MISKGSTTYFENQKWKYAQSLLGEAEQNYRVNNTSLLYQKINIARKYKE